MGADPLPPESKPLVPGTAPTSLPTPFLPQRAETERDLIYS